MCYEVTRTNSKSAGLSKVKENDPPLQKKPKNI